MTISSEENRVSYAGNDATVAFSFPYRFLDESGLVVLLVDDSTGDTETQVLGTDYTTSGEGSDSGGTVTFVTAPATGETVVIYDDPPLTQETDYTEGDPFSAETHEGALDKLTKIAIRTRDLLDRAAKLSDSDTSGADVTLPTPVASRLLGWNASGDGFSNYSDLDSSVAVSAFVETLLDDASAGAFLTTLGVSAFAQTILDDADAATARATLGLTEAAGYKIPAGVIAAYGGASAPTGWLLCDGSAVSRTTYSDLFTAISTTYGVGDGSTTFNVPDMRGRVSVGAGTGAGLTARTLGATGGAETHQLIESELAEHTHTVPGRATSGHGASGDFNQTDASGTAGNISTSSTGGDGSHNNMQPFLVNTAIIKT